ncbi:hypothetical protein FHU41_000222 [Psychromicrobium silvestre]|uniref:Uncharacterized protein n=1 Tax=Psychromicrobium silvestre TaxID=1645614 RepID=A0A7Y9LR06_9MICC|nr:hypothetical protein [Psychromicrobium silvestre]NYE94001.1 hypothetical protein [Psychromicrobium silvestre]
MSRLDLLPDRDRLRALQLVDTAEGYARTKSLLAGAAELREMGRKREDLLAEVTAYFLIRAHGNLTGNARAALCVAMCVEAGVDTFTVDRLMARESSHAA